MKYKVILNSCGNIDYGENPFQSMYGVPKKIEYCNSIEECQKKVRDYIDEYELGSGQWNGGEVYNDKDEYLGHISYNSRFWPVETK